MRVHSFFALVMLATSLEAQSTRVSVDLHPDSPEATWLESEGFLLEPIPGDSEFIEIVLPDTDLPRLEATGVTYQILEHSQPLRDRIVGNRALDSRFFTWAEINQKLLDLGSQYPSLARRQELNTMLGTAQTHEGRSTFSLVISDNPQVAEDEQNVLFVGNHHSREIATPAHMIALAEHLLSNYGVDPEITAWIDQYQIWITPTWNPDGLEHVWNVDEWWRKNRRNNGGGVYGVDLNRNYLFDWANCGSYSTSPSSNVYCGPSPGSEPETQTMLVFARQMNFVKVIDVHQSGQEVLYPYACGNMATAVQSRVWEARDNLAAAANYSDRYASAGGEHFEWEFNEIGALSFLIELDTTFFPSWTQSQAEINRVIPLYLQMLREETPISGHVRDAWTGASLDADFTISGVSMYENETRKSRASNAGRWHSWIENGNYDFTFSAPGYQTATFSESLTGLSVERDVWLMPDSHPSLSVTNPTTVGSWIQFTLDNSSLHSGKSFTVIFSSSNGGPFGGSTTLPGGLELPIVWDRVSDWTVNHASLLSGSLGSQGTGLTPWLVVPPAAAGMTIWASAAIHNGTGQSFYAVSPALIFEVQ